MFVPSKQVLTKYAQVLVDFALGDGQGIKERQVIYLQFDLPAMPLALAVYKRILEKGAYPILKINDEAFSKIFYQVAQDHQLEFFPKKYSKALVNTIDHRIYLMAEKDPLFLKTVDPQKIIKANKPLQTLRRWLNQKEDQGKLTWTLCLYGTPGLAKEAGLSLEAYWQQIIKACFLDAPDPVNKWRQVFADLEKIKKKINALPISKIHILAKDTDLWLSLGDKRKFVGGSGRNIPSFEIFTSPDWRGTEGDIFFDLPLYRYGNIIKNVLLRFKKGKVIKAHAENNQKLLEEIISQKNADKVGEFSLTDNRFSRIDRFMAQTLYDENFGGKYGNTHLAIGTSYHDTYKGNVQELKQQDWQRLGYNESPEHVDLIATGKRMIEVMLKNSVKRIIYKDGRFLL